MVMNMKLSVLDGNNDMIMENNYMSLFDMSQEEREIYALLDPDAQIFAECDVKSIIESREEILAVLN